MVNLFSELHYALQSSLEKSEKLHYVKKSVGLQ